jgi:hypothetical protein
MEEFDPFITEIRTQFHLIVFVEFNLLFLLIAYGLIFRMTENFPKKQLSF